jgi:DNA-binding XRE family transcriptional regulator
MILKEEDIYNGFESYRNKNGLSQEQMAHLVGLSTKQAYGNMIKNRTMKLKYLINLVNNTGVSSDVILNLGSRKEQQSIQPYPLDERVNLASDEKLTFYNCPECIEKEKQIKIWKDKLLEKCLEIDNTNLKYQRLLEEYLEVKKEVDLKNSAQAG